MADQRSRLKADIHHIMQQARRREHTPGTVTVHGNATVIVCDNSTIHVESPPASRAVETMRGEGETESGAPPGLRVV